MFHLDYYSLPGWLRIHVRGSYIAAAVVAVGAVAFGFREFVDPYELLLAPLALPFAAAAIVRDGSPLHVSQRPHVLLVLAWLAACGPSLVLREDRLVLPIPPGTHWSDAKPLILPGAEPADEPKRLAGPREKRAGRGKTPQVPTSRRLTFAPVAPVQPAKPEKKPREKAPRAKNDPRLVAAARELRDRWLERVDAGHHVLEGTGKYDVSRVIDANPVVKQLPLAA